MVITNVFKLRYHQARPFWVSPKIQAFGCSTQYGNPSGHSMTSIAIALIFWYDYNREFDGQRNVQTIIWRTLGFIVAIAYGLSIGYSRVFLGVHSINQLFFGWSLGIWLAMTLHFCFRD